MTEDEKKFVDTILAENGDLKRQLFEAINSAMRLLPPMDPNYNPFADFDQRNSVAGTPSRGPSQ